MAFVTILRPQTEAELAIALAILEAHDIESFVHGQYFGSLFPGLQIDSYNARSIMVPEERVREAREALAEAAPSDEEPPSAPPSMRFRDKLRIVLEAALFGWFVPGGRK
jgi:Putative prokaryotic signal transducing protein